MGDCNTSRHRWSWRSCFAILKHNKRSKIPDTYRSDREKLTGNGHVHKKKLQTIDENGSIRCDVDESNHLPSSEAELHLDLSRQNQIQSSNKNDENYAIDDNDMQSTANHIQSVISNQKSLASGRATQLDAIVEELNEDNADESDQIDPSVRLCSDHEIINECRDLHSRLFELSKLNHIIIQFNDRGYLYGEFTRQISKLKLKINDLERISNDIPRDAELLEAKYSTLLATIENLSLLVKLTQTTSLRSLICRIVILIEQRMEQLNKVVQLAAEIPANLREHRRDFADDDFLSFRSAFSSYEHLLNLLP